MENDPEISHAKTMTHLLALEELVMLVGQKCGISELDLLNYLKKQKMAKWQEFLEFVEKHDPELAARIDNRGIDEISL